MKWPCRNNLFSLSSNKKGTWVATGLFFSSTPHIRPKGCARIKESTSSGCSALKYGISYIRLRYYEFSSLLSVNICIDHCDTPGRITCKFMESPPGFQIFSNHNRFPFITPFPYILYEWNLSKERDIIFFRQPLAAVLSKNIVFVLRRFLGNKITHIFHKTDYRRFQLGLPKHGNGFLGIGQCHVLR